MTPENMVNLVDAETPQTGPDEEFQVVPASGKVGHKAGPPPSGTGGFAIW